MGLHIGSTEYPEGQHVPEEGLNHNWHVWCSTGALRVLKLRDYETWFREHPGEPYTINYANNSSARIKPGHPLWEALLCVAETYVVEVFPLGFGVKYQPWIGIDTDIGDFDAIKISEKIL